MSGRTPEAPAAWPMIRALVGVGLVCGLLIVAVYELTAPVIARNRAEALGSAVFETLPGAAESAAFRWAGDRFVPGDEPGERVFAAYDDRGRLVGVAVEAAGMGYQDVIKLLYGYAPGRQAIVGMVVLESRETPGLGDKIETDPDFRAGFESLDVSVDAAGAGLARPIEIDSITGATVSSVAVAGIVSTSAETWIPRIRARLADLEKTP